MDMRGLYRKTQRTIGLKSVIRRILPTEVQEVDGLRYRLHPRHNATERYMWAEWAMPEPRSFKALGYETIFTGEGNSLLAAKPKADALRGIVAGPETKAARAAAVQATH